MHRFRSVPTLACLGALAAALLPSPVLAPTESEPNDDPAAEGYAGALPLPSAPTTLAVDGILDDADDVDAFRLDAATATPALLMATGFTASLHLQGIHSPGAPGDGVATAFPYPLRYVAGYSILDVEDGRLNLVGVSSSTLDGPAGYLLRVVTPGTRATASTVTCVFKDAAGADSFKARLDYDPSLALGPGTTGDVEVRVRDFSALLPASAFKANRSGTKFVFKAPAPGVTKCSWNTKKGIVTLAAKRIDFTAPPTESSLPCIVLSEAGGVADTPAGSIKAGAASTKISGRRK